MKISLSWLNEYVDIKDFFAKPEDLANQLIAAGLEVESIENQKQKFNHVVIGQIVELGRHPNADKLTLCQVNVGGKSLSQIVCGAKNHKQGDKVVVALPGAILPGDFAIKLSKIRDVESQGMLCSESELGLKSESEGIVILPTTAEVGASFAEHAGLNDVLFEINVTPNRADCLSHMGLAREISCLLQRKFVAPKNSLKASVKIKNAIKVDLKNKELCTRYCGRTIQGVEVKQSPDWLKNRLQSVGLNSINNIVDVTNFVMLEFGQPLHAFDANSLTGQQIIVDNAKAGDKFKTFDGTELSLKGSELTIRDRDRAVALAGVIGGLNSGVTEATNTIFLESAHFNPKGVRRTARGLGIDTDSSYRFSRGTDPDSVVEAMNRAAELIVQVAGGEVSKDFVDEYPAPLKRKPIKVSQNTLSERLGYEVSISDFAKWMKRLHFEVKTTDEVATVQVPSFRVDIDIEMDLVEEYARLNGYDKIPESFPALQMAPSAHAVTFTAENVVGEKLRSQGFFEARNYSFVNPSWQKKLVNQKSFLASGLDVGGEVIAVRNPLSEETSVMRQSLLPGLIKNLLHNYNHGVLSGRLFELGYVFGRSVGGEFQQNHRLALIGWGSSLNLWKKENPPTVLELKSALDGVLRQLQVTGQWKSLDGGLIPEVTHPGQFATLFLEGRNIGFIGTLHPSLKAENKIRVDVAVAEIDLTSLMRGQPRRPKIEKLSKYPSVDRDLALLMPQDQPIGDVLREVEKAGAPMLRWLKVFDIFTGQGIPEGQKSVAIRYQLQDLEATLSDEKLGEVNAKILQALDKKFSIRPR